MIVTNASPCFRIVGEVVWGQGYKGSETALFLSGRAASRAATPALWCEYLQPIICPGKRLKEVFQPANLGGKDLKKF